MESKEVTELETAEELADALGKWMREDGYDSMPVVGERYETVIKKLVRYIHFLREKAHGSTRNTSREYVGTSRNANDTGERSYIPAGKAIWFPPDPDDNK